MGRVLTVGMDAGEAYDKDQAGDEANHVSISQHRNSPEN
jgi:hypothetical protein